MNEISDIGNPWHGCKKISPGCQNCYMYFLDKQRNRRGSVIYRVKHMLNWPLKKDRYGQYYVPSGSTIRVCMTSDFFLQEADKWRADVWDIIRQRPDVFFFLLTKRIERAEACLPDDWGDGWKNVWLNVSVENQQTADQRIPQLVAFPAKHKGIMFAPLLEAVTIDRYLASDEIAHVMVGGENYAGARPLHFEWVQSIYNSCVEYGVNMEFIETGNQFTKDGKTYFLPTKELQAQQAKKAGLTTRNRNVVVHLADYPLNAQVPLFETAARTLCDSCSFKNKCSPQEKEIGCQLQI